MIKLHWGGGSVKVFGAPRNGKGEGAYAAGGYAHSHVECETFVASYVLQMLIIDSNIRTT